MSEKQPSFNPVSAPAHYLDGRKFTATECIRDWDLNFFTGNTVKYISRAGRKPGSSKLQDMEKALWYLQAEVDWLKSQEQVTKSDAPIAGTYSGQEHSIQRNEANADGVTDKK